ncbi:MAG: hypothetical protein O2829_03970 [Bacteroidetes bacterium]|nr:hypothetical protein [Bacteroidota bacterium]MDA1268230.1 hypothetical protein [Bacteroidota bacterium]
MEIEKRFCQSCAQVLQGRIDKKFCDDGCRNNFNNHQNSVVNREVRSVNRVLKRNRTILIALLLEGKKQVKVRKESLLLEGFNFSYSTHQGVVPGGNSYQICYDVGLILQENSEYLILRT